MLQRWAPLALLLLVAEAVRNDGMAELLAGRSRANKTAATVKCKLPDGSYHDVPSDICPLMQKENCCCERISVDQHGRETKQRRGNPPDLFGLCPANYCSQAFARPGESCEGTKYAWTCHRTRRMLKQGLGCATGPNGKASDSQDMYDRLDFYQTDEGIWRIGKDPAEAAAEAEHEAELKRWEEEQDRAFRAQFAKGNIIERFPAPMHGILPASEEGLIVKGCESAGTVCTIWYYTKGDSLDTYVQKSHEEINEGFAQGHAEWRRHDGLESKGQWSEFEFDPELLSKIKRAIGLL